MGSAKLAAPSIITLEKVEPFGQVTTKVAGWLPTVLGKNTDELKYPLELVRSFVADSVVMPPLRNSAKPVVPFWFPLMLVQLPETVVLTPGNGLELKANELTAAVPILTLELNLVPLEQTAVKVAGPSLVVLGMATLSENVAAEFKLTLSKL